MPKHGIDQVCTRRTPVSVLGTVRGPSWAQALVSPRMSLNTFPSPYAILKNIIIRSKYDASARHPMVHVSPYKESTVTAWTCPKVIRKKVFLPFRLKILSAAYFTIFFFCTIYQNTIACELWPNYYAIALQFLKTAGWPSCAQWPS